MRRVTGLLLAALALLAACDRPDLPVQLQVGAHTISVVIPPDWEHLDYGDRHHFRRNFDRIVIEDLHRSGRDLEKAAEKAMVQLREDGRREIATSVSFQVDKRNALVIDTWDLLSHQYRERYVFMNNKGDLLVIYMMQGRFETMEAAFGELLASFTFVDSLAVTGTPVSNGGE